MTFAERLRNAIEEKGVTVAELARQSGLSRNTLYSFLRRNTQKPDPLVLRRLSDALNLDVRYFLGVDYDEAIPVVDVDSIPGLLQLSRRRIPILGPVAAGVPILADPTYEEYVSVCDDNNKADAGLRVQGDSMTPRYLDGDIVLIRFQPEVHNGQVAAVQIDDDVTLKHVYHIPGGVQLTSDNPKYPPMTYTADNSDDLRIIGLAVGYLRWE